MPGVYYLQIMVVRHFFIPRCGAERTVDGFYSEYFAQAVRYHVEREAGYLVVDVVGPFGVHPNHLVGLVHGRPGGL